MRPEDPRADRGAGSEAQENAFAAAASGNRFDAGNGCLAGGGERVAGPAEALSVAVVSLGCDKNRVDTEYMLGALTGAGHRIVQYPAWADVILVNTCAFLESARREGIDTVLALAADKRPGQKLLVAGCLPERYADELASALPEVDGFLGVEARESVLTALAAVRRGERYVLGAAERTAGAGETASHVEQFSRHDRVVTTPPHFAYLKIADGCDNRCTYCLIPAIRGRYRSVPPEDLEREARELVAAGAEELILVAQDLTRYGTDLGGKSRLVELIRRLSATDARRIRLLYCYPEGVGDDLIAELRDNPKLCKYIDVPLQHVADGVLKRMNRRTSRAQIDELLAKLRREVPGIVVRTTLMVGFPGESEADFAALEDFVAAGGTDYAGFFAYSDEEEAPSFRLPDKIPERVKRQRLARVMRAAERSLGERLDRLVGSTAEVVCDGADFDEGVFFGRTDGQAPDVDPRVILRAAGDIESGARYLARFTGRRGSDLYAELIEKR